MTILLSGCGDALQPRVPTSIRLDHQSAQIEEGQSVTITAAVLDQHGVAFVTPVEGFKVAWTSSAPEIASVRSGVITGESPGTAEVVATAGTLPAARVDVQVDEIPVGGVLMYAITNLLRIGATLQIHAYVFDTRGELIDGSRVTWTSLDPDLASVSSSGILSGRRPGWAEIRVSVGEHSDVWGFHIRPPLCSVIPVGVVSLSQTVDGALESSDCDIPFQGNWPIATFADGYRLDVDSATTVRIELTSQAFDAVLYVSDLELNLLAYDRNSGEGSTARIDRELPAGSYLVWASSYFANSKGAYRLDLRERGEAVVTSRPGVGPPP